jgi:hypothetical protein
LRPPCEEKHRLRVLYNRACERYSATVNDLILVRGKTTKEEYNRVQRFVDEARDASNAAGLALEQHKQEHGC